jgi:hypothetical protein
MVSKYESKYTKLGGNKIGKKNWKVEGRAKVGIGKIKISS